MTLPCRFAAAGALLALAFCLSARADELKLKDGTKISGTIVGFEENSFKVKTSYGFAVVQKDQVVSISMSDAARSAPPEAKPDAPPAPAPVPVPVASKPEVPAARTTATPRAPLVNVAAAAPAIPSPAAALPKPPSALPIREAVVGNLYTNETYGFQMYKPPAWDLIAGARKVLPGAIAAMGTYDQSTYLLIGQEPAGKSLAADMDATEQRLRDVMDNFRQLGQEHVTISGVPAVEAHFRGSVDQHDWSGIAVVVAPHGSILYTIFGMTRADDDLVQIQENVIARTISSLQFMDR